MSERNKATLEQILNKQILDNIGDIEYMTNQYLLQKKDSEIEGLLTEHYFGNKIQKSHFPNTKNWWIVDRPYNYKNDTLNAEKIAICISKDFVEDIDITFGDLLNNDIKMPVLYIIYRPTYRKVSFILNDITYNDEKEILEELHIYNKLTSNDKNEKHEEITKEIINWFHHNINECDYLYNEIIIVSFIRKYFYGPINLDIVLFNEDDNKFYILELKRKTSTKEHEFFVNKGEFEKLYYLSKNSQNIVLNFLMIVVEDKKENKNMLTILMGNGDTTMYIFEPTEEQLDEMLQNEKIIKSQGRTYNEEKETSVKYYNMQEFRAIENLAYIGATKDFSKRINAMFKQIQQVHKFKKIFQISDDVKEDEDNTLSEAQKNIMRLRKCIILYFLTYYGYKIDYKDYAFTNLFYHSTLTIGGYKVLFKPMEDLSWNFLVTKEQYERLNDIDFVVGFKIKPILKEIINEPNKKPKFQDTYPNDIVVKNDKNEKPQYIYQARQDDEFPYNFYCISAKELKEKAWEYPINEHKYNQKNINLLRKQRKGQAIDENEFDKKNGVWLQKPHWMLQIDCRSDGVCSNDVETFCKIDLKNRKKIYPNSFLNSIKQKKEQDKLEELKRLENESFIPFAKDCFQRTIKPKEENHTNDKIETCNTSH